MNEPKTVCRTPTKGRDGSTSIPTWKYEAVRTAILDAVRNAGADGLAFKDLSGEVKRRLSADELARLGSVMWHTTSVKLNMEVQGELCRLPGKGPQRLTVA
ncbi:MAG TPA: hypothetical protein ENJ26_01405 [Rhodobacteraceae bacterium]|nr:hypothetical protein [Paracoccaceae bacterium]